jgi:hypothetical protein
VGIWVYGMHAFDGAITFGRHIDHPFDGSSRAHPQSEDKGQDLEKQ